MLSQLKIQDCQACSLDAPKVSESEQTEMMKQLHQWKVIEVEVGLDKTTEKIKQLERIFKFKNFKQALEFTNKVAEMAEHEGHHPALLTEWGKVTVTWWSHSIKGLHHNDFICAAKTDALI